MYEIVGINGLINKVNIANIKHIIPDLFRQNLVRGKGLFARALMKAQMASPGFSHIYCALLAVVNTKMPENGELVVKRVIMQFRRSYKRNDKVVATALAKFIAHLVNQQIAHELMALQMLALLLEKPTDDSVEVAVNFTKEVGQILMELSPKGLEATFKRFRGILHEGEIDKRAQYTIEGLFTARRTGFKDYPAMHPELDLVETSDQITHEISLGEKSLDKEEHLDVFHYNKDFEKNEELWAKIRNEILDEDESSSSSDDDSSSDSDDSSDDSDDSDEANADGGDNQLAAGGDVAVIQDMSEVDLVNLRRTIYLTIMSSLSFDECAHKLLKLNIPEGQEMELCTMIIECCSQERTYMRHYGLLAQRFCLLNPAYAESFDSCFKSQYEFIDRLETNKLRNVAKLFSWILCKDALPWTCFECISLDERSTTSAQRIFIKIMMQTLAEQLGLKTLRERLNDEYMQESFRNMFPKENPKDMRFSINFFISIGLGALTCVQITLRQNWALCAWLWSQDLSNLCCPYLS